MKRRIPILEGGIKFEAVEIPATDAALLPEPMTQQDLERLRVVVRRDYCWLPSDLFDGIDL